MSVQMVVKIAHETRCVQLPINIYSHLNVINMDTDLSKNSSFNGQGAKPKNMIVFTVSITIIKL